MSSTPSFDLEFNPQQWKALTTEANEILYGGAAGGGKSWLMRIATILYGLYIPGLQMYLFRRKYKDLMSNHMVGPSGYQAMLQPWVDAGKVQINLSDYRIDFFHEGKSPAQLYLRHIQHDKDMYNYLGTEIHFCGIDETTLFPSNVVNFIRTRVRMGSHKLDYAEIQKNLPWVKPGHFPRILCGTNPGNIGHVWVKKAWIDPAPPEVVWQAPQTDGGMRRVFFPAKLWDNKALLEEDPHYADRLLGAGGKLAKAMLEGSWDITDGGALDDLWDADIHVIDDVIVPEKATIYRSMDWGTFDPSVILYTLITDGSPLKTVMGEQIFLPKNSLVVIKEIYNWDGEDEGVGNKMTADAVGKQMADFEAQVPWRDRIFSGPADGMIFANRGGTHNTIHDLLAEGYNQRMASLARETQAFSWHYDVMTLFEKADQGGGARIIGLNLIRDLLKNAVDFHEGTNDQKGLYFVKSARHCITTIPTLPRSETNPEDVQQKGVPDHAYDTIRYMALSQSDTFEELQIQGL